jgi:PIN domain nuclease of toxin-antitoxin system
MIVLDTHAWVWWVSNPEHLSHPARKAVDSAMKNDVILISSISTWEVALLVARDRLKLRMEVTDWITKSERLPFVEFIPIDNAIVVKSVSLPEPFHNDLADRIIIATAISMGAQVVTKDKRIIDYPHVETIW